MSAKKQSSRESFFSQVSVSTKIANFFNRTKSQMDVLLEETDRAFQTAILESLAIERRFWR